MKLPVKIAASLVLLYIVVACVLVVLIAHAASAQNFPATYKNGSETIEIAP